MRITWGFRYEEPNDKWQYGRWYLEAKDSQRRLGWPIPKSAPYYTKTLWFSGLSRLNEKNLKDWIEYSKLVEEKFMLSYRNSTKTCKQPDLKEDWSGNI